MAYTSDGKLSVRSKHGLPEKGLQIDCSKVAAAFREGGGHPGAAGGFLKTNIEQYKFLVSLSNITSHFYSISY
jgi:oligoribonuclease NrnB/cAMP/cGMP phosphodiesterase (DHH superfamily)